MFPIIDVEVRTCEDGAEDSGKAVLEHKSKNTDISRRELRAESVGMCVQACCFRSAMFF